MTGKSLTSVAGAKDVLDTFFFILHFITPFKMLELDTGFFMRIFFFDVIILSIFFYIWF